MANTELDVPASSIHPVFVPPLLDDRLPKRVLDLGCGDGGKLIRWANSKPDWEFEGVYYSEASHGEPPTDAPTNTNFVDPDARDYLLDKPECHYALVTSDLYLGWNYPHTLNGTIVENIMEVTKEVYRTLANKGMFKSIIIDDEGAITKASDRLKECGFQNIRVRKIKGKEARKTNWTIQGPGGNYGLVQVSGTKKV